MVQHRKSSASTFIFLYVMLSMLVAGGLFYQHRSTKKKAVDLAQAANETVVTLDKANEPEPEPKKKPESKPKPEPDPKPEPNPKPEPDPKPEPEPEKKSEPEPKPETEPKPEPKPEPKEKALDAERAKIEEEVAAMFPLPKFQPLLEIVDHWRNIPKNAFPKLVTVHQPVDFAIVGADGSLNAQGSIPAGSTVIPVSLNNGMLTVSTSPTVPIAAIIAVDQTDFKERIQTRYDTFVAERSKSILEQRKAEVDRRLGVIVAEEALSEYNDGSDPRFDPMKESLRKAEAGSFELVAVSKWRWGGEETIGGTAYQVGFAIFSTESAFGVSERELKALILENKVEKWIDVQTGQEL